MDGLGGAVAESEFIGAVEAFPEGDSGAGARALDGVECCFADASGRGVDDAEEGDGVGGVGDDAEVGDCVFDFFAIEECGASRDSIGDGGLAHCVFEYAGECVGAVEDGHVFPDDVVVFVE